jgi:hypothetical protein
MRVGIVWAGSPLHRNDHNRSIPLEALLPLADIAHVHLISLQTGEAARDVADIGTVADLGSAFTDFADTAAAIAALDLVIAVDTAVAHLAGALGKPVWILLPFVPDWRWMTGRDDSPWYPSARLFRQQAAGDWTGVIRRVLSALSQEVC